jgi:hypothetical protein
MRAPRSQFAHPGGLLAVRIKPHGWASALTIEAVLHRLLVEHVYTAELAALALIDAAVRAAQEL